MTLCQCRRKKTSIDSYIVIRKDSSTKLFKRSPKNYYDTFNRKFYFYMVSVLLKSRKSTFDVISYLQILKRRSMFVTISCKTMAIIEVNL